MKPKLDLSVIVPCYNEDGNLPELVSRLIALFEYRKLRAEIILIDDASTDDTGKVILELSSRHACIRHIFHERNQGIAESWHNGCQAATAPYLCLIDADLQYQPEDIWRLLSEIRFSHCDLVQGFRSHVERQVDPRFYYSRFLNVLLNSLFSMRLRDNKSGFVIARKEVLTDILNYRHRYRYFQTFITVAAYARGYTIREIEVLFRDRLVGSSFINKFPARVITGVLLDLFTAFFEFRCQSPRNLTIDQFLKKNPIHRKPNLGGWRRWFFEIYLLLMPFHHWNISRRAGDEYDLLDQTQWMPRDQIRELQEIKLRQLIQHAYHHVNHYREILDRHGIRPDDIQTLDDLGKLPLLDKATVREHLHFNLMSDNHRKDRIVSIQTSGSTGQPFTCYVDKHQLETRWAATLRGMEWSGYRFGDKQARLWHQNLGMNRLQVLKEKLNALFSRRLFIPAYEMTDESLPRIIRRLERYRPILMDGYAESFNFLAHYIREHRLPAFRPKSIISSAQILPDSSRTILEETFGCGVYDKYGSREFSGIAYECQAHDGKHIVAEHFIVEILVEGRPAKPGEIGEVVITDLNNYCMPFIRYRIGDLAEAKDPQSPCACGRSLPKIGRIEGRVQAIILGDGGRYLPGTFFAHFFKDYEHLVRHYQVVQHQVGAIELKIVKALRYNEPQFQAMLTELQSYLGKQTVIRLDYVDAIPMVRTGKRQGSISKLDLDYQNLESQSPPGKPAT
jgi:phenylacetate-CoA ligase